MGTIFDINTCYDLITDLDNQKQALVDEENQIAFKIKLIEAEKKAIEELFYIKRNAMLLLGKDSNDYVTLTQNKKVNEDITFARMINSKLEGLCEMYGIQYEGSVTMQNGIRTIRKIVIPKKLLTEEPLQPETKKSLN